MAFGVRPLATAGFFVLVAFLWTLLLQHIFPYPFLFLFLGAVTGSAWFGGAIAGFVSVIFSTVTIAYFFVPPMFSWSIDSTSESYFVAFIVCAAAVSWVSSSRKRNEAIIKEARDRLEEMVLERTAELEKSYREIQESERRLRLLTEAIPQQIWSAGPDGEIEYCNQHLLDYVARTAEELQGDRFMSVIHAEDQEPFRESWTEALSRGSKFEGEYRIRGADGRYRRFLVRSIPQASTDGQIARWYGTHIDIEERRRIEEALIEARSEVSRLSRTLSMGEFAASIAHELNQPLTAVVTHAYACREWLATHPANLERANTTAEKIVRESERASAVVARIRALFQRQEEVREQTDINRLIHNLLPLLRDEAIRRDVLIRTSLYRGLPVASIDSIQIQQVLINLAMNAMEAMTEVAGLRELLIATDYVEQKHLVTRVEDCGTGLNPETASKIFEPFFTTKPRGIGLGLSISRSIIEAHDGRLWAAQRPSGGSIFQFTIPVNR